jgi:Protein of unknown function (DUF1592)/Protein of unknown function (DUF1588)/Protein of unknown function (DUF1585)/Protein of unknown function (DUF1595)/Protein of unknown function (DUF1587)
MRYARITLLLLGLPMVACSGTFFSAGVKKGGISEDRQTLVGKCEAGHPTYAQMRQLTKLQYQNAVSDLFGDTFAPADAFPPQAGIGSTVFSSDAGKGALSNLSAETFLVAAEENALAAIEHLGAILPCSSTAPNRACASTFIEKYARKAFRRPLNDDDRNGMLGLYDNAMAAHGEFNVAIAELAAYMLQSGEFLYQIQFGTEVKDGVRELSGYELATRLSFAIWERAPDEELDRAASADELRDPAMLEAQARRMLSDERFKEVAHRFVSEWSEIAEREYAPKDETLFPEYSEDLVNSMHEELSRFMMDAIEMDAGGISYLLEGRETWVNRPLAALYGLPEGTSASVSDWKKVTLGAERSGLITRSSVLSGLAGGAAPSHVRRGKFVRFGLLCNDLGAPPADALTKVPAYPANASARERSAILQGTSPCGSCHVLMDPIGLAFENFDALGKEHATNIDTSGEIKGDLGVKGTFNGAAELGAILADSDQVSTCISKQWFRYTFGRHEVSADACVIHEGQLASSANGRSLSALLSRVVSSEGFRFRATSEVSR